MEVHVTPDDRAVETGVGDTIVITLPENGGTGYRWSIHPSGSGVVLESEQFLPPGSAAPGASGHRIVTLRAAQAGSAVVEMRLQRPWEAAAATQRELAVTVHG